MPGAVRSVSFGSAGTDPAEISIPAVTYIHFVDPQGDEVPAYARVQPALDGQGRLPARLLRPERTKAGTRVFIRDHQFWSKSVKSR